MMKATATRPLRVLICDDSAVVRASVRKMLEADEGIKVVATAGDPYEARDQILATKPDVLTLDLEMPRMDGLSFLKIIMREHPMPVIIISSLSQSGSQIALEALQLGAVEVIGKPKGSYALGHIGPQLVEKVKAAAEAGRRGVAGMERASLSRRASQQIMAATRGPAPDLARAARTAMAGQVARVRTRSYPADGLLLLGASTGGTEALKAVLTRLPADMPPIAVVQHIPPYFSRAFADRLNTQCALSVKEAVDGDVVTSGQVLVAPGDQHMVLERAAGGYRARLNDGAPVWHQRPAVDLLFTSAVRLAPRTTVAAVLTGMGRDGAEGLLALRKAGARTFAQDEASSVVWGMPKAAWEIGGASHLVSLDAMADTLVGAWSS